MHHNNCEILFWISGYVIVTSLLNMYKYFNQIIVGPTWIYWAKEESELQIVRLKICFQYSIICLFHFNVTFYYLNKIHRPNKLELIHTLSNHPYYFKYYNS